MRRFARTLILLLILVGLFSGSLVRAQNEPSVDPLPASICILVNAEIRCYLTNPDDTASPETRIISQPGERALDFALSPEGGWIVYRNEDGLIRITSIIDPSTATNTMQLDQEALPSAALERTDTTIAWSPDGITIAYLKGDGFRTVFPTSDGKSLSRDFTDRQYVNLRFSPGGARLAVQDSEGFWSVYSVLSAAGIRNDLRLVGTIDQPSDAGWLDDNSLIIAPRAGGLTRYNLVESGDAAQLSAVWSKPDGLFATLMTSLDGHVLGLQTERGAPRGLGVSISADGTVEPIGDEDQRGQVDLRVSWINPRRMVYITSGTPILVNPGTGGEDSLPFAQVSRVAWATPSLIAASTLSLDADLYYLAPGDTDKLQVWALPGDGLNSAGALTRLVDGVRSYSVSPDRRYLVVATGDTLATVPGPQADVINPTATPFGRRGTPTPTGPTLPGVIGSRVVALGGREPDWSADGRQIAFVTDNGLFSVDVPFFDGPFPDPVLLLAQPAGATYTSPRYRTDRGQLLATIESNAESSAGAAQHVILELSGTVSAPFTVESATWGLNALYTVQSNGAAWELSAQVGTQSALLARSDWPIVDVRPIGGATDAASQQAVYLRNIGWRTGPEIVQLCATSGDPAQPEIRGAPIPLASPVLSPTGRFAAGFERRGSGTLDQLVILDLQNGRKVAIRNAVKLTALRWIR